MITDSEPRLLRLAEAIGDRSPVPWDEVRSMAGEVEPVVHGLKRVQALAEAFAASQTLGDRAEPGRTRARWGQLEILATLGEGAFGEVVRARDPNLDREVALKLRHAGPGPDDSAGRRLLDEARKLARIRHPNVVAVYGADLCDGRIGIWTELIEGPNLEQRLQADGPLGAGEAISIGLDLCRALAAVHAAGLVHGDVKTANVLRDRGGRIVLTDLGSATEAGARPVTGSPATLAPEVLTGGPATASADLYSLGVLLFRLLSGRFPGDAANPEAGRTTLRDLRPDLPSAVIEVVERAADPDPERRFSSAGVFEQALGSAGRSAPAAIDKATAFDGSRARTIAATAAVLVVAAVAALAIWNPTRPAAPPAPENTRIAVAEPAGDADFSVDPPTVEVGVETSIAAPASRALEVRAAMFRPGENGAEELAEGSRIRPGDRLSLEFEAAEPVHAWVVNEDLDGNVFLLFPIAGLELANPLPGDRSHRLPGRIGGVPQYWQVTSAGGRERFLVIASRHPLPELERELAELTAAGSETAGVHRGVGGIAPAPPAGGGRRDALDTLVEHLDADRQRDGSVWVRQLELVNP